MEIIIGKTAGFCFGVKNAITKTKEELENNKNICCLGELVHNNYVTEELKKKGASFIENLSDADEKVIIRAHGIPKDVYEEAEEKGIELIDLTCPKVLKIHNIAQEYSEKGYFIVLTGKNDHPEIIGIASFCGKDYCVLENEEEIGMGVDKIKKLKNKKILIISQTTYSLEKFEKIVSLIKNNFKFEKVEIKNTICSATKERQKETEEIAKTVDAMIIIGGKHSSNTNKLYEIALKYCKNTFFIDTEKELSKEKIKMVNRIGIMAGASTPGEIIKTVVEKIEKM